MGVSGADLGTYTSFTFRTKPALALLHVHLSWLRYYFYLCLCELLSASAVLTAFAANFSETIFSIQILFGRMAHIR